MNSSDATSQSEAPAKKASRRRSTSKKPSLWNEFWKVAFHPGVMAAFVTATVGSLAVAIATNSVTKKLGERELQFKIVEALIQYTKEPGLNEVPAISKLDALTSLIKDNSQFSLDVDGFQVLVKEFREDELRKARGDVARAEAEKAELVRQSSIRSDADKRELREKIANNDRVIGEARGREREARDNLARAREDLLKSGSESAQELQRKEKEVSALQEQLKQERARADSLDTRLQRAMKEHTLRIVVDSVDTSDESLMALQFSDYLEREPQLTEPGFEEFTFPGSAPNVTLVRSVRNTEFLRKRYLRLVNASNNGWAGTITISVNGQRRFSMTVSDQEELRKGSRSVTFWKMPPAVEIDDLVQSCRGRASCYDPLSRRCLPGPPGLCSPPT